MSFLQTGIIFVLACVISSLSQNPLTRHRSNVTGLVRDLMNRYEDNSESFTPPLNENFTPIEINVNWYPTRILSLNEHDQFIELRGFITIKWFEPLFQWDPNENGVRHVELQVDKMWKPLLVLNESRTDDYASVFYENHLAIVYYDGQVEWESPVKTSTFCQMLLRVFPFDRQACKLTFLFAANYKGEVVFKHWNTTNQLGTIVNGAWEVEEVIVPDCPEVTNLRNRTAIRFVVGLKRRRQRYYVVTLVIPCFLLSFLISSVFYLPVKSQQKIPLIITTVLALFVYQGLVSSIGPPTGSSLLGIFTLVTIFEGTAATSLTILSIRLKLLGCLSHCRKKEDTGGESTGEDKVTSRPTSLHESSQRNDEVICEESSKTKRNSSSATSMTTNASTDNEAESLPSVGTSKETNTNGKNGLLSDEEENSKHPTNETSASLAEEEPQPKSATSANNQSDTDLTCNGSSLKEVGTLTDDKNVFYFFYEQWTLQFDFVNGICLLVFKFVTFLTFLILFLTAENDPSSLLRCNDDYVYQ